MIPAEHTQNTPSSGSLPIAISVISSSSPSAEFKERPAPGPYMNPIQPGSWFDSIPATPKLETENRSLHLGQIAIDESDGSTQVPFTVRDSPSDSATTSDSGSDEGTNSQGITGIARLEIIKRYISKRWAKTATDLGSNFPPVPTASQVGDMASSLRMNEAHKYLWNNPTELVRLGSPNRKIVVVGGDVLKILGIPDQLAKALRADLLAADDSEDGVRSILEVPPSNRQCPYNSRCRTILPWSDTHKMRHLLMHLKQHGVHIKACCPCCGWLLSRSDALFAREHWRDLEIRCRGSSLKPSTWSCYTVQSVMTNVNRYLRCGTHHSRAEFNIYPSRLQSRRYRESLCNARCHSQHG